MLNANYAGNENTALTIAVIEVALAGMHMYGRCAASSSFTAQYPCKCRGEVAVGAVERLQDKQRTCYQPPERFIIQARAELRRSWMKKELVERKD